MAVLSAAILFPEAGTARISRPISDNTAACLDCHASVTPGIVSDWKKSRHAVDMRNPVKKENIQSQKGPAGKPSDSPLNLAVGCAECHTMDPSRHKDTFDHNGFSVHIVVSPADCASCHQDEANQYKKNLMSHAYGNLMGNPLYRSLMDSINGTQTYKDMKTAYNPPDEETDADSCLYCHGTVVKVTGMEERDTSEGEMTFPVLSGWPNQGVGRINPDGTSGSCSPCHVRHQFSIELARKPYTCSECHKGPDVPAYKVYNVSKHGNIFSSMGDKWDFSPSSWTVGKDFTAPTCAVCHMSALVSPEGDIIAKRTHRMNDRLPNRIFGLIYAHAHPKSPDTSIIENTQGLGLPTELTGEPVSEFLIGEKERQKRQKTMEKICLSCHGRSWVKGHFARLENTIKTTNQMTLTATRILLAAWEKGAAKGPDQKDSIFNEAIEKMWVEQWLFFANTTRFASAMAGADYGAFADGRWDLSKNIQGMADWLEFRLRKKP